MSDKGLREDCYCYSPDPTSSLTVKRQIVDVCVHVYVVAAALHVLSLFFPIIKALYFLLIFFFLLLGDFPLAT